MAFAPKSDLPWEFPGASGPSPAAAARRFDSQPVASLEFERALAGKRPLASIDSQRRPSCRAVPATGKSPGLHRAPIGKQGHLRIAQQLNLSYDAVAPAMTACSSRTSAKAISRHAKRKCILERLDRRVQRVCHVRVMSARASASISVKMRLIPASSGLSITVRENSRRRPASRIPGADSALAAASLLW